MRRVRSETGEWLASADALARTRSSWRREVTGEKLFIKGSASARERTIKAKKLAQTGIDDRTAGPEPLQQDALGGDVRQRPRHSPGLLRQGGVHRRRKAKGSNPLRHAPLNKGLQDYSRTDGGMLSSGEGWHSAQVMKTLPFAARLADQDRKGIGTFHAKDEKYTGPPRDTTPGWKGSFDRFRRLKPCGRSPAPGLGHLMPQG
jgi:hypothetical protein